MQWKLKDIKHEFKVEILFDTKEDDTSIFDDLYVIKDCNIIFIVHDNYDCEIVDSIVVSKNVTHYSIIPYFDGDNSKFIIENVFPTKEEILGMSLTKREIFCNQTLNPTKFGHLTVIGATVYSDVLDRPIGQINESFHDLVIRAIDSDSSWMSTRNKLGCSRCLLRYLCPPMNNLERELKIRLNINCFFK